MSADTHPQDEQHDVLQTSPLDAMVAKVAGRLKEAPEGEMITEEFGKGEILGLAQSLLAKFGDRVTVGGLDLNVTAGIADIRATDIVASKVPLLGDLNLKGLHIAIANAEPARRDQPELPLDQQRLKLHKIEPTTGKGFVVDGLLNAGMQKLVGDINTKFAGQIGNQLKTHGVGIEKYGFNITDRGTLAVSLSRGPLKAA